MIELLVVVTIIVLLIAIFLPSMSQAIKAAGRAACTSNLHQIQIGISAYASDAYGMYPPLGSHFGDGKPPGNPHIWKTHYVRPLLEEYLGNRLDVLFCPFHIEPDQREAYYDYTYDEKAWGKDTRKAVSYLAMINPMLDQTKWSTVSPKPIYLRRDADHVRVGEPDKDPVLLADTLRWSVSQATWLLSDRNFDAKNNPEGGNVATVDGSVYWKPFSEMTMNFRPSAGYYSKYYW